MEPVKIELPISIAARLQRLTLKTHPNQDAKVVTTGLLGEFAVLEYLRQRDMIVSHTSVKELSKKAFDETFKEGSVDIVARSSPLKPWQLIQVKSSSVGGCAVMESCLYAYRDHGIHHIYFVDVVYREFTADCWIYHRVTPDEVYRNFKLNNAGDKYISQEFHHQPRSYRENTPGDTYVQPKARTHRQRMRAQRARHPRRETLLGR